MIYTNEKAAQIAILLRKKKVDQRRRAEDIKEKKDAAKWPVH